MNDAVVAEELAQQAALPLGSGALILPQLLKGLREHLNLKAAFISQFTEGQRVFRYVDQDHGMQSIPVGTGGPLEESYCARVVDGRMPELICNAQVQPEALALPVTTAMGIGAHLSVPIRLSDGSTYGTFCCFSMEARPDLNAHHLGTMRLLADIASGVIEREMQHTRSSASVRRRVQRMLQSDAWFTVYQPITSIETMEVAGFEALSRFQGDLARTPDVWFNEATNVGLAHVLETRAVEKALADLHLLPPHAYLSCNVSPAVAMHESFLTLLDRAPLHRLLLEVTEHASVQDYTQLASALSPLRKRGLRLAVDDAGAGYASFSHILKLHPDVIKLDVSLTRDIDVDQSRRALAAAFVGFSRETGCSLVAEGVETAEQLATLRNLGVQCVQGYFIGKPARIEAQRAVPAGS